MIRELLRVTVEIDPKNIVNEPESHTPYEVIDRYDPWVTSSTDRFLTLEGVTFAAQLARNPTPRVRVALAYNSDPHPLIAGGWLWECCPTAGDWLPAYLEDTDVDHLYGFQVSYLTPSTKSNPVEYARAMVKDDVRGNFRYQIRETTVEDEYTTFEIWIPELDTGNLSCPERLFPTATERKPLGSKST